MIVLKLGILGIWMFVFPLVVGGIVSDAVGYCGSLAGTKIGAKIQTKLKIHGNPVFLWVAGQMLLWAVFQLICVPMVLLQWNFSYVTLFFALTTLLLCGVGAGIWSRKRHKAASAFAVIQGYESESSGQTFRKVMWVIFWLLLAFQLVMAAVMTYADGDDAYFVAVSSITKDGNTMYLKLPYTGGTTSLDVRHGLAPFPIWISFLSKMCGLPVVSVAHVAVPMMLIPMTYGIFYLIGSRICKNKEKLPVFLVFTELLVLFGDYSFQTAENFMIARSRQGKAALGNIVLPMMIFLLLVLLENLQENVECRKRFWILFAAVVLAGCLCTTLGAMLLCMLIGTAGICGAVCYRKWKILIPMAACCIPAVVYAFIYLIWE